MAGVNFIDHKGVRILYEDYSNGTPESLMSMLDKAQAMIAAEPQNSILALVNVTNAKFNNEVSQRMKEFVKANTPYIKMSAIFGMSGLQAIIYRGVLVFAGRKNLVVFNSEEEAKEFLIRQK